MKITNAFSIVPHMGLAIQATLLPTCIAIFRKPSLLWPTQWRALSAISMAHLWAVFGEQIDTNSKGVKERLLKPADEDKRPRGVVLDVGAGYGLTAAYLERSRVSCYVALEPNPTMHAKLRALANDAGFYESDVSLVILTCGAEDPRTIRSELNKAGISIEGPPIDSIISILSLCTVPNPQRTISNLVRDLLKTGGVFYVYEHVLNHREDVAWWQRFWAPMWSTLLDGCRMDRPTDVYLKALEIQCEDGTTKSAWKSWRSWPKAEEEEEALFCHSVGTYVKG